jgi:hypothetical protein
MFIREFSTVARECKRWQAPPSGGEDWRVPEWEWLAAVFLGVANTGLTGYGK